LEKQRGKLLFKSSWIYCVQIFGQTQPTGKLLDKNNKINYPEKPNYRKGESKWFWRQSTD